MLQPNGKIKYRRVQRGRMKGKALRGNKITNGEYGLSPRGSPRTRSKQPVSP